MIKFYCDKCGNELSEDNRFVVTNHFTEGVLQIKITPTKQTQEDILGRCCVIQEVRFLVDNRYYQQVR